MSHTGHRTDSGMMDDIISAQEASEMLGLSKRQVIRLAESGQIVGKLLGKQWAISKTSVLKLKAKRIEDLTISQKYIKTSSGTGTNSGNVIGTKEAAQILDITQRWVIRLINNGELTAHKIGKQWAISRQSVLEYKAKKDG